MTKSKSPVKRLNTNKPKDTKNKRIRHEIHQFQKLDMLNQIDEFIYLLLLMSLFTLMISKKHVRLIKTHIEKYFFIYFYMMHMCYNVKKKS